MTPPLQKTYLIQRLKPPRDIIDPFCDIKVPLEQQDVLRIFSFDYMGSAEFEWGAVPNALEHIRQYAHARRAITASLLLLQDKSIDYICELGTQEEVAKRIKGLYEDESTFDLKDPCCLRQSVEGQRDVVGWLELDNGFMFFNDSKMYDHVAQLFKVGKYASPSRLQQLLKSLVG